MLHAIGFFSHLLVAVILHEIAHGYVAEKLGDPTAKRLGRITLNPIPHIDPFMTIILPAILILSGSPAIFGGAKPVPVNPLNFTNPRRHMAYVALAGPALNFSLAVIFYACCWLLLILAHIFVDVGGLLLLAVIWMIQGILVNLVLGVFNLLPIPPLDGGRIAVGFLPISLARPWARLEPFGIYIVFALLFSGYLDDMFTALFMLVQGLLSFGAA